MGRLKTGEGRAWIESQQGNHFCQCGCGGAIEIKIHHNARGIPKYITGHCSRVNNPMSGRSGSSNPHYKGGRYINQDGYVLVLVPGPGRSKYVLEHRLKMEKKLGRKLKRSEIVHHRNEIKHDNRLRNLKLDSNSNHSRHHALRGDVGFRRWKGKWANGKAA